MLGLNYMQIAPTIAEGKEPTQHDQSKQQYIQYTERIIQAGLALATCSAAPGS